MDYTTFEKYPIQILGIDESYNDEINEILSFVTDDIAYTGDASDLDDILPYFVFYKFCEKKRSEVNIQTGETTQLKEFTEPSLLQQINAWNIGVKKLDALCVANETEANEIYLSKISMI